MIKHIIQRWINPSPSDWTGPPVIHTASGKLRRIGIELEFSGLGIEQIARIVKDVVGGSISPISPYECDVDDTPHGTYHIELDSSYVKRLGRHDDDKPDDGGLFSFERLSDEVIGAIAKQIVPFEIVTPPIPMPELGTLNELVSRLRKAGAQGTHHSPIYAFGLHMNPELPDTEAATLLGYLQAFVCLFPWLARESKVDWSRRVTPYIDRFPSSYTRLITAPDYAPDLAGLIDDYLDHNATRNRALDMLPVFGEVDWDRIDAALDTHLVKPRPALHYRLPNCLIDEDGWTLDEPWRHWLQVEHLAHDEARRQAMMHAFRQHLDDPVSKLFDVWARDCEQWLLPLARA
ncbi:amidoligase family protein [Abyssibacter sp.]|uniref:amidoligase family protein n=1 Tax=Abyssibacter sp. TaxID=2320200 RepID=UPI003518D15B